MATDPPDPSRRQFLSLATAVVGGLGLASASIPFLQSWLPSAKTQASGGPVQVDLSKLEEGQKITVSWRGQPIFIVHRSLAVLKTLPDLAKQLRDPWSLESDQPDYAKNIHRSLNEKYLILLGICTHLGCVPIFHPEPGALDQHWPGGFFCPCHGSKYDIAGRVFKGVPAPLNLAIPPYHFINDHTILIGESAGGTV